MIKHKEKFSGCHIELWFVSRFYGPGQPNGVMSSAVNLPNHTVTRATSYTTVTGQA